jgi:hypothetical protein
MLTTTRHVHRPAIACAIACALFASAISTATARPLKPAATPAAASSPASEPRLHQPCAGVPLPECERQVLASRGVGAPTPPAGTFTETATGQAKANVYAPPAAAFTDTVAPATPSTAARLQSTDTGFDWGSAGIGAAATGGLILVAVGGLGVAYRARIRVAR